MVKDRLRARLAEVDDRFTGRLASCAAETFLLVSRRPSETGAGSEARWRVSPVDRSMSERDQD
jgi:hypothetical protein